MTNSARKFLKGTIFYHPDDSEYHLCEDVMTPHGVGEITGFSTKYTNGKKIYTYQVELYYDGRTKDGRIITTKRFELVHSGKSYHQKFIQKLV